MCVYFAEPPACKKPTRSRIGRPVSAKYASITPKVDTQVKEPRVASAGVARRGPFVRTAPGNLTTQQQQNNGAQANTGHSPSTPAAQKDVYTMSSPGVVNGGVRNGHTYPKPSTISPPETSMTQKQPVYDSNGLRLDRTPTDDEINWLWDKVRTCLSRDSSVAQSQANQGGYAPAQTANARQQQGDPSRISLRVNTLGPSAPLNVNGPFQRHKVPNDNASTYTKRHSLVQQRKQTKAAQMQREQGKLLILY